MEQQTQNQRKQQKMDNRNQEDMDDTGSGDVQTKRRELTGSDNSAGRSDTTKDDSNYSDM